VDITEPRRAEEALAEALAKAERARQDADAASLAKSIFLATMSHEIRTPMNAVLGLANTLLETELDDEQRTSIVAIQEAGDSLLGILNDILDFSKLEAGRISFEQIAFSPEALIHNALSIVGPRASAKRLRLRIAQDLHPLPALTGEAGRIRQVLLNLITNAVKFTNVGEVVVCTRCLARDESQATIEWSVSDTGIGISPDRIGALFREFVQADNTINRRFGGSGLGLAICKRIVEQMGGDINVVSAPGQGSTFRFTLTLPLAKEPPQVERGDANTDAELKLGIASLCRPLSVLIADDNPSNRLVVAKMLKQFDIQIASVGDGVEAVKAAMKLPYDMILMDVRMPEMDGLQATRVIRAHGGALTTVPIIAFTANAFAEDVDACLRAGMNDFVVKPVRKKVLISAILRAMPAAAPGTADQHHAVGMPPNLPGQAAPVGATAMVDRTAFDNLAAEIGDEGASETFHMFLAETDSRLKLLRRLSCETDRDTIEREAHSLKGSAGTFGLREVSRLAENLERKLENIAASDYCAALDRLEAAFADSRGRLPVKGSVAA
jgi:CheY-like chemotaxis protein/HPt (histidine-containing phosphotransfer) domain-containing protein